MSSDKHQHTNHRPKYISLDMLLPDITAEVSLEGTKPVFWHVLDQKLELRNNWKSNVDINHSQP